MNAFPRKEITGLIYDSAAISERNNPDLLNTEGNTKSLVMSVSEKKNRPNTHAV